MISVVIPTYRGEKSLPELIKRLNDFFVKNNFEYELIIVNDASPDNTKRVLREIKSTYENLKVINLLRNYGQHNAILCGFRYAKGDIIITMDDDLQNPPEEIIKLIKGINMGFDLVIGAYQNKQHNKFRNVGGQIIDIIQRKIFSLPDNFQLTSFRAIKRNVIDAISHMSIPYPYITSMLLSQTTNYINIPVRHEKRVYGSSNYNIGNSLRLALNLIINYSSIPVYFIVIILLFSLFISLGFAIYVLIGSLFFHKFITGWASVILMISFFNTLNLLTLLIFGLYIARIYQMTMKVKSSYVISEIYE